jgi:hypothetical protein
MPGSFPQYLERDNGESESGRERLSGGGSGRRGSEDSSGGEGNRGSSVVFDCSARVVGFLRLPDALEGVRRSSRGRF